MYRVGSDPARRRVVIGFEGFLADRDLAGFEDALKAAVREVRATAPWFDLLVDFRGASVMPQETAESSLRRVAWCVDNGLRRAANIVSSPLLRMQLQRLTDDSRTRHFTSPDEAVAWLDSAD